MVSVARMKIKELVLPRGVTIRTHPSNKKSLQIAFSFDGQECRPTLRHIKVNASGVKEAERRLHRINNAIESGEFDYVKEFPESKHARRMSGPGASMTVKELLAEYFLDREKQLASSTMLAYRSMAETRINPG